MASITRVGGGSVNFGYDANGNLTGVDDLTAANFDKALVYNAFNKPTRITAGGVTADFRYGADLARFRQDKDNGEVTLYIDKHMEIVQVGSTVDYRHYLGEVAILTKTGDLSDPSPGLTYLLRDRLGSVVTVTDESGADPEVRGYDPFGKPRDGDWADRTPPVLNSPTTERGFTAHEHLDESQLIHMNGRAYDYNLGRFLSVDPFIQSPGNSQSLNPYSYIMNNPLSGTDPSGYASCNEEGTVCEETIKVSRPGSRITDQVTATATADGNTANIHLTGGSAAQQRAVQNGIVGSLGQKGFQLQAGGSIDQIGSLQQRDSLAFGGGGKEGGRHPDTGFALPPSEDNFATHREAPLEKGDILNYSFRPDVTGNGQHWISWDRVVLDPFWAKADGPLAIKYESEEYVVSERVVPLLTRHSSTNRKPVTGPPYLITKSQTIELRRYEWQRFEQRAGVIREYARGTYGSSSIYDRDDIPRVRSLGPYFYRRTENYKVIGDRYRRNIPLDFGTLGSQPRVPF